MHIICSNFGSIQPESKVAVWSTCAKPAMSGSQAGSFVSLDSWQSVAWNEAATMWQMGQLALVPAHYIDIETGEPIPNSRCLHICKELDRIQLIFQEGRNIYKKVFRATPGSYEEKRAAAVKASDEHAGGGYTVIWNRLCQDKIAISLVATAPPAKDKDEAEGNEERLLIALYQCDSSLKGMWQDIWTSA